MNLFKRFRRPSGAGMLQSCPCTQAQLESTSFQAWAARLGEGHMHMHRKVWEYCYITQALYERNLLHEGCQGLGFAVGQEPLSALFASLGCDILATDLATDLASHDGWVETNQHAANLDILNKRGICRQEQFESRVRFRFVDMRDLTLDLGEFDFIWSACSFEHLGTMELGEKFVYDSLKFVKPGGWAIHTTEYNLTSNHQTLTNGPTVLYRRRDIERIARQLRLQDHQIELDFTPGEGPIDKIIDRPPYKHDFHLRLEIDGYVVTSIGLIIRKSGVR